MLDNFDLKKNPFEFIPSRNVEHWAGNKELRDVLIEIVFGAPTRNLGFSELVTLHGEFGTGKSHAFRYLDTYIRKKESELRSLSIYVESPQAEPETSFLELYKYIITEIGKDEVTRICQEADKKIKEAAKAEAGKASKDSGSDHDLGAFESVVTDENKGIRNMLVLLQHGASNSCEVFEFLAGKTQCPCQAYEGKIDSDTMAVKVLGEFFSAITTKLGNAGRVFESVYLFVDECDILFTAKGTESDSVFLGVLNLIDSIPCGLVVFLGFSAVADIVEVCVPQKLLERITDSLFLSKLRHFEAVSLIKDQLELFRTENSSHKGTFYPFSKESVDYIVNDQMSLTPIELFVDFKHVLDCAIKQYDLTPGETISSEMVEEIFRRLEVT